MLHVAVAMLFKQFDAKAESAKRCCNVTAIPSTTDDAKTVGVDAGVFVNLCVSIDTITITITIVKFLLEVRHIGAFASFE